MEALFHEGAERKTCPAGEIFSCGKNGTRRGVDCSGAGDAPAEGSSPMDRYPKKLMRTGAFWFPA
jgi:hypothetical protein